MQIPANMLNNADIGDADNVTISIGIADIQDLDEDVRLKLVIDLLSSLTLS